MSSVSNILGANAEPIPEGWFDFEKVYDRAVELYANDDAVFVEVGTWLGQSAIHMALELRKWRSTLPSTAFYCVDTWKGSPAEEIHKVAQKVDLFKMFMERVVKAGVEDYIAPIQRPSNEAARMFRDRSVDFVFIDADHSYEGVGYDLKDWYPKTKKVIAGHDWRWGEVNLAVRQFAREHSLKIKVMGTCWWIEV